MPTRSVIDALKRVFWGFWYGFSWVCLLGFNVMLGALMFLSGAWPFATGAEEYDTAGKPTRGLMVYWRPIPYGLHWAIFTGKVPAFRPIAYTWASHVCWASPEWANKPEKRVHEGHHGWQWRTVIGIAAVTILAAVLALNLYSIIRCGDAWKCNPIETGAIHAAGGH